MHEKNIIKVGVLICNNKASVRYPGKNDALRCHSVNWLFEECAIYCRDMEVFGVELLNPCDMEDDSAFEIEGADGVVHRFAKKAMPAAALHLDTVKNAMPFFYECDVVVLAQLTQPCRRPGLLSDCVAAALSNRCRVACTYCESLSNDWRVVVDDICGQHPDVVKLVPLYDGALYAWTPASIDVEEVFDMTIPKTWVKNYTGDPVDVDYSWQHAGRDFSFFNDHLQKIYRNGHRRI